MLEHSDVLVVAALERIGRLSQDFMGKSYALLNRGVRLRSLADNGVWDEGSSQVPVMAMATRNRRTTVVALLIGIDGLPGRSP